MELIHVSLTAIGSVVVLFLLTKLMGNRQISQLTTFDYVNGITIGSIAAEMATSLENDFLKPLIAMIIYALAAIAISIGTSKSIKLRRLITGETLILFDNGRLYQSNLNKAKMDLGEFLTQCRINGYFNLASLQTVVLELNGRLSFLPKSTERPPTAAELNLAPPQDKLVTNIILDGKVLEDNLKFTGNNRIWLQRQLRNQGFTKLKDVFLAICDSNNQLTVYRKYTHPMTRDMFE
ncbi:MAG: DUF421 domain-containing protein [Clostridia bacterium]|nr:DUF421 domain-containing protein [Clostridia bacterium]